MIDSKSKTAYKAETALPSYENDEYYPNLEKVIKLLFSSVNFLNKAFSLGLTKLSYSRPNIDFEDVATFYTLIDSLKSKRILITLLEATLSLLKRPRHKLDSPSDIFFLLIILENPIFVTHSIFSSINRYCENKAKSNFLSKQIHRNKNSDDIPSESIEGGSSYNHKCRHYYNRSECTPPNVDIDSKTRSIAVEILERTVSILSNTPKKTRHYLLNWISRYPASQFQSKTELLNAYISYRLTDIAQVVESPKKKQQDRIPSIIDTLYHASTGLGTSQQNRNSNSLQKVSLAPGSPTVSDGMPPGTESLEYSNFSSSSSRNNENTLPRRSNNLTSRSLSPSGKRKRPGSKTVPVYTYGKDWKIASFARLQSILFNANIITRKMPVSQFYNTMVDYVDIKADFEAWERLGVPVSTLNLQTKTPAAHSTDNGSHQLAVATAALESGSSYEVPLFAFCEYPFFISMGTKTRILEHDARRQMAHKAHEAFFNSISTNTPQQLYLHVSVRRSHILEDSFEVFESHEDDLKKGIRVHFIGEPGIDVGGLKKEWFLLLMRELFKPERGIFLCDEESGYSWFNIKAKQPLKYYKLTGVALGLALYNSTILDTNFHSVIFRKLFGAPYTFDDLKDLKPSLGKGLQQLLDYEGDDLEEVFSLNFTVPKESETGSVIGEENLIPNGCNISVTKKNRQDYVKRVIAYHLETSIRHVFEPLKQGFYKVVASNALTLFRPEEIELLIHGSDEEYFDVDALRAVTRYNHWSPKYTTPDKDAPVVQWFWKYFKMMNFKDQRKLLMFVTGSDRIPATGIATMTFSITRAGGNSNRYPVSHTCFNELCLYEYDSKQKLVNMLTRAIFESEGFGLK